MNHYRYGATLRPFTQLNLNRLEACDRGFEACTSEFPAHGTMLFHRLLTPFEESQLDLIFLQEESREDCPR